MLNKILLIGNLGKDPETRYTQNGTAVCNFSLATTEKWKGQDGQLQEQTEWHTIVVWKKLAELCQQYLHKGSKVYIEGKLATRKWQDQQHNDRYTTEVIAREVKFLDPRPAGTGQEQNQGGYQPEQQSVPDTGEDAPF
jgi:single-strand DNA-binding protein